MNYNNKLTKIKIKWPFHDTNNDIFVTITVADADSTSTKKRIMIHLNALGLIWIIIQIFFSYFSLLVLCV